MTSTTSCRSATAAWHSRSATSPARPRRRLSTARWRSECCASTPPSTRTPAQLGFENRFLALGFGVYDSRGRRLTLANSGLPHPYLLRGRSLSRIEVEGIPLGLFPRSEYAESTVELQPGDSVILISDGVEDSLNAAEEGFGPERVAGTLQRLAGDGASQLAAALLEATRRHAGEAETYDDRTALVLKAN